MSTYYINDKSGSDRLESSIAVYDYAGGTCFESVLKYGSAMIFDRYVVISRKSIHYLRYASSLIL